MTLVCRNCIIEHQGESLQCNTEHGDGTLISNGASQALRTITVFLLAEMTPPFAFPRTFLGKFFSLGRVLLIKRNTDGHR
jgi:hypothetical protein